MQESENLFITLDMPDFVAQIPLPKSGISRMSVNKLNNYLSLTSKLLLMIYVITN